MKNLGLIPVRNFGIVDAEIGLYRSAQPMYNYEYEWLKSVLGVKTIVNLRKESNHDDNMGVKHGLQVIDIMVPDHKSPTLEQVDDFYGIIQNKDNYPLLFHCEHGHGRTSTFCVLARLALGWDLDAALIEEKEIFHYQFKYKAQEDFLSSLVKKDLVV